MSTKEQLEITKLELEVRDHQRWWVKSFESLPSLLTGLLGLGLVWRQQRKAEIAQADERQRLNKQDREALLAKAIANLGKDKPMLQTSAVVQLESFALDGQEQPSRALIALGSAIELEVAPATEAALLAAFVKVGRESVDELVLVNRRAQAKLARACGRIAGVYLSQLFPGAANSAPPSVPETEMIDAERKAIFEVVARAFYAPWPLEETSDHSFIDKGFWLQFFPAYKKALYNEEKFAVWRSPPQDLLAAQTLALEEGLLASRFLARSSMIIENVIRSHSGSVGNLKLRNVYLVAPDLRDINMTGIDLQGSWLPMVDLRCANLSRSNCRNTNFDGANFSNAKLTNAELNGANLAFTMPFPIETTNGYTHSYTQLSVIDDEDRRFLGVDLTGSTWRSAASISPRFELYAKCHFG